MAEQIFTQKISEDAAGRKHVSIGQTRDGKDEWITPVTMWEKNKLSGLYLPPGFLPDDDVAMPRVKVQLPGSENFAKDLTIQEVTSELELVKAELQAIKANQLSGDQKVTLSGKKSEVQLLANAMTVAPETSVRFTIETLDADEIWVGVATDKAPWSIFGTSLPWHNDNPGRAGHDVFYPRRINVQQTHTGFRAYATSLLMNMAFAWPEDGGLPLVQSFSEAMLFAGGYPDEVGIAYQNLHETDNATVTIRLLRRWK